MSEDVAEGATAPVRLKPEATNAQKPEATKASLVERLSVGHTAPVAADPVALVIFGGAGDLAHRKLLPALYNLHLDGLLPPRTAIVGIGRPPMKDDKYR